MRLNDRERYERRQFEQLQIGFFATGRPDIGKILARDSRIIVVSVSSLHLFEKPLSRRAGYGQFKIMRQAEPARDLHVFEHVFERKVRLKIRLDHLRQFHRQGRGMTGVAAHRLNELLQGQADGLDEGQRFRRSLDACGRHHISRDFDRRGLSNFADHHDFLAACFKNRPRLAQGRIVPCDIIKELAFFRGHLAAGEWRFDKARAAAFDNLRRGTH